MAYFLIYSSEDGPPRIAGYDSAEQLQADLNDNEWDVEWVELGWDFECVPDWRKTYCLLIKGKVLDPKPKDIVRSWDF